MRYFVIIVFFLSLCSCQSFSQENKEGGRFEKFPIQIKPELREVKGFVGGYGMLETGDEVFYRELNAKSKNGNWVNSINSKKENRKFFAYGSGIGQFLGMMSWGTRKDTLWGYDITQKKVFFRNIKDSTKFEEYNLPHWFYSVKLGNKLNLFATGGVDLQRRVRQMDLTTMQTVREFGEYPIAPKGVPQDAWRFANDGFLLINEKQNKVVIASRFTDKVEFIDLKTDVTKIAFGPEGFHPKFEVMKQVGYENVMVRNQETRFAFNGMSFVSDRFLYLGYSGEYSEISKTTDLGKYIFVYNWEGEPVAKIELPEIADGIIVRDDSLVYISIPSKNKVYEFSIKL